MKRPDIYIGLVGAAGTDLDPIKKQLKAQFAGLGYAYDEIKVSRLITEFSGLDISKVPEDERITYLMDAGDAIRKAADNGDGVMSLVMSEIRRKRDDGVVFDSNFPGFRGATLYVIDSLKNPSEIVSLDGVYARNYYTISVYTPEKTRIDRLSNLIKKSRSEISADKVRSLAISITKEDEGRNPPKLSQDVLRTFPRADFFIRAGDSISKQVQRFTELIFGNPFITPTQDEHFMNLARTASLRSCDLSRQVGAVIVDDRGAVISQGCNEVPYPGGGIFYENRPDGIDNRDHVNKRDPNQATIMEVVTDFIKKLRGNNLMSPSEFSDDEFTYQLLLGKWSESTADARITNLIEFGRVVHAEMHAICEAARLGRQIDRSTLYCTTFPCHGCARHIIASGIQEVVFIEPYPKSLTKILYGDEIRTDEPKASINGAVLFRPFEGVSPILFRRVFNMRPRKNEDGSAVKWDGAQSSPLRAVLKVLHYEQETSLVDRVAQIEERYKAPVPPASINQ